MILLLAQTKALNATPVLIWAGVLIVCAMIGGTFVMLLRKKMLDRESARNVSGSLMEDLRRLHDEGRISDAEYEQTRKSIASRVSHELDTKRAGGLFELPDPKRRAARPAPAKPGQGSSGTGGPATPMRAPPGYDLTGEPLPKPADPQ